MLGVYHAFEAARRAGCRRVVFASSVHAVGGYPPGVRIRSDMAMAPVNLYGATKVWGESLARVYSEEHGLSCLCLRIGWAGARDDATKLLVDGAPVVYLTYEDAAQLFAACIDAPDDVRFGIFHATSGNQDARLDLAETERCSATNPTTTGSCSATPWRRPSRPRKRLRANDLIESLAPRAGKVPAIDDELGSGAIRRLVRREEQDEGCHLLRSSHAGDRLRAIISSSRFRTVGGACSTIGLAMTPGCTDFPGCRERPIRGQPTS